MKKIYVICKYVTLSNVPVFFSRVNGNLEGGRYDTKVLKAETFDSDADARFQIVNELEHIELNELEKGVFKVETFYV